MTGRAPPKHPPLWPYPGAEGARSHSVLITLGGFVLLFFGVGWFAVPALEGVLYPVFLFPFQLLAGVGGLDEGDSEIATLGAWWAFWGLSVVAAVMAWTLFNERRRWISIGLPERLDWSQFWQGMGLGGALVLGFWIGPAFAGLNLDLLRELGAILSALAAFSVKNWIAMSLFAVGVVALALMEEVLFRGWLLSSLSSRLGLGPAVLISSTIFALYHFQYYVGSFFYTAATLISIFVMGLFFAVLTLSHRSIVFATGLHAAHNIVLFLFGTAYRRLDAPEISVRDALWIEAGLDGIAPHPSEYVIGAGNYAQIILVAALLMIFIMRNRERLGSFR